MEQKRAFYFNPTCEMEVANGLPNYMPPALMKRFTQDLEMLPLVFACSNDCVLVHKMPSQDFLSRLENAGFDLPQFVLIGNIANLDTDFLSCPWGWSPAVAHLLSPLGASWNDALRPFFSRLFALEISQKLGSHHLASVIDSSDLARYVDDFSSVEDFLKEHCKMVIKAPYSSSGRGVQMLNKPEMNVSIANKTKSIIKQQGGVMVEPLMEVLCDIAFEFQILDQQVSFVGYSSFSTNENGQYESHQIPFSHKAWPEEAQNLWCSGVLSEACEALQSVIQNSELPKYYEGCFGVDAFIFRSQKGEILLQPCLEINLRRNMGFVALSLESHIAPSRYCDFQIVSHQPISLSLFDEQFQEKYPLVLEGGKIVSGYLPLTSPCDDANSMAYILVS